LLCYFKQITNAEGKLSFYQGARRTSDMSQESCENPPNELEFGGANRGGVWSKLSFAEDQPAVFICSYDRSGAKNLRFSIVKTSALLHSGDLILALLLTGVECQTIPSPDRVAPNNVVCRLDSEETACARENIKIAEAISDPETSTVCLVVYCENPTTSCFATISATFIDQFGYPSVPIYIFAWGDEDSVSGITFPDFVLVLTLIGQIIYFGCCCWRLKQRYDHHDDITSEG